MTQPASDRGQQHLPAPVPHFWDSVWRVAASLAGSVVVLVYLAGRWPLRLAFPVCFGLVVVAVLSSNPPVRRWRSAWPFLAVTATLPLLPSLASGTLPGIYDLAALALIGLSGWGTILWLAPPTPASAGRGPSSSLVAFTQWAPRWLPLFLCVIAVAVAAAFHRGMSGNYAALQDEVLYLLQSEWLAQGRFGWPLDSALLGSLRPEFTDYRGGVLFGQYPPGWPALLAVLDVVHLRWWASPLLTGLTVLATFRLGRALHSPLAGLLAAALLVSHPWFLAHGVGYMSGMAAMACLTMAATLLIGAPRRPDPPGIVQWVLAGLLLGYAVAIRPLTAVAIGVAFGLWMVVLRPCGAGEWTRRIGLLALGAALPLAGLLYYNWQTTGSALKFGYEAVHGHLHALGFGPRGFLLHGGGLELQQVSLEFTPALAAARLGRQVWDISARVLPFGVVVPLLWLAHEAGCRIRWRYVLPMLLLPAAYFFYFFNAPVRFVGEMLPFAFIGVGCLLAALAASGRGLQMVRVTVVLIVMNVAASRTLWEDTHRGRSGELMLANAGAIEAMRERYGRVVVFISEPAPEWYRFRRLSIFNGRGLDGAVIVARDLGAANSELLRYLPTHTPLRAVLVQPGTPLRLEPLGPLEGR